MKRVIQVLIAIIAFSFSIQFQVLAIDYYWIGGSGNWNDVSHWATNSGNVDGILHIQPPTVDDNVIFDNLSFDPTTYYPTPGDQAIISINDNAFCASMTWTGALTRPILSGTSTLTIGGALTLINDMDITFSGPIVFASNNLAIPNVITSAGKVFQGSIQFNNKGLWELADPMGIIKDMTIANGTLDAKNQTITSNGNWTITNPGKFISGTGTVILTGNDTDKEIKVDANNSFYNLIIDKNNSSILLKSKIQVTNDLTISKGTLKDEGYQINEVSSTGKITIENGASLTLGDDDTANATIFPLFTTRSLDSNSTVNYRDRASPQNVLGTDYGNLILSNGPTTGSTLNIKNLSATTKVVNNLTVGSGIDFRDNGYQINGVSTNGNKLTLSTSANPNLSATLTLGNNTIATTFPNFTNYDLSTNSTVNYAAGVTQSIKGLTGTSSYGNLTLSNATATNRTKTLDANVNIKGNLNIGSNNTLDVSTTNNSANIRDISIQGNWTGTGWFAARTGTVTFNSTIAVQTITANTVAGSHEFHNLVFNNKGGGILLNSDVSVGKVLNNINNNVDNGTVTFTEGIVRRPSGSSYIFTANNNTKALGASTKSYVIGPVKKKGNDAFEFPVGNEPTATQPTSYYRPIGVTSNNNQETEYLVQYFNTPAAQTVNPAVSTTQDDKNQYRDINKVKSTDNGLLKGLNGAVSRYEYWFLNNLLDINGSRNANITLKYEIPQSGPESYLGDQGGLVVAGWSRDNYWENRGGANQKGTPNQINGDGTGVIYGTEALSARMNVFTIGTIAVNALPIELLYFKANLINNAVQFSWATAKEENNNYFTVEKSSDGIHFDDLLKVDGAGNSQEIRKYSASDANPLNGITYYRLKQTDFDGKFAYSKTEAVHTKGTSASMFVYAPDSRHIQISYTLTTTQKGMITIHDSKGVKIWSTPVSGNPGGAIQTVSLPVKTSGWYLVSLQQDAQVMTRKLIVP